MRRTLAVLATAAVLVVPGCGGTQASTTTGTAAADLPTSAEAVFNQLATALQEGDHARAARLTDPAHIPLLAVAEGVGARELAELTSAELALIAENFWQGFSTQLEASLGAGLDELRAGEIQAAEAGGDLFGVVDLVLPADASARRIVFRDTSGGWVVDLIASFPSPILGIVPIAADAIRESGDAALGGRLVGYESSIRFVLAEPELPPQLNQAALAALESIGR